LASSSSSRPRPASPVNSLLLWNNLALKSWEALASAAPVIGSRTARMALAGGRPGPGDRREFVRMGSEKMQAATESSWAMALQMQTFGTRLVLQAWTQWMEFGAAAWKLGANRDATALFTKQAELWSLAQRSQHSTQRLTDGLARVALSGLAPVHRTVTANARRLGRR
jgi:hypothetical protein